MINEYAFEMAASSIRFGWGATREVGMDLAEGKVRRVLVITDPTVRRLAPVATVLESLEQNGIEYCVYDRVRVEPTDESCQDAARFAREGEFDAFVAVGGGSTIDTAKMANLYSTYPPADFLDYVNPPIGRGLPPPGPLKPLFAVPTTAGTGSETTGVAIFDYRPLRAKTGVAHRRLKPTLGIIDPENTATAPPAVAACSGLDVLSHAIESYTALPYTQRPRPSTPVMRPAYQGSNPISDIWSLQAIRMVAEYLPRAVEDPADREARAQMILAASYAGVGFGNAGVHLPHGMSYPVSGMVRAFQPAGYAVDHPIVPHGMSVILNAPAVFRFTAPACPERHLRAAEALRAPFANADARDAGKILADCITELIQRLGMPNGLRSIGYGAEDIPALVAGTLPQHRVTKLSPRPFGEEELARLRRRDGRLVKHASAVPPSRAPEIPVASVYHAPVLGQRRIRHPFITMAGQTAPGDGITLRRHPIQIDASEVIIRYLRIRLGDESGDDRDAVSSRFRQNIVLDHLFSKLEQSSHPPLSGGCPLG